MKQLMFVIMVFLSVIGSTTLQANDSFNKTTHIVSFSIGDVVFNEDKEIYEVKFLFNTILSGKNRRFQTFVQMSPAPGRHNYKVFLMDRTGKHPIASYDHGDIEITHNNQLFSLYSNWNVNIKKTDFIYVVIIDTYNGKQYNVGTFKILVE